VQRSNKRGEIPPPAVAKLIGFDLISVEPGKAVVALQAHQVHTNPMGTLHGGILRDIANAAMGIAYASNLDEGESFTTSASNKPRTRAPETHRNRL
jgi:acyl-coenzyme A thioesterase PaaI-like protein